MARIRSIKPEFWDDEHLSSLPMACRLFYIGCWTFADDQGVFNANPSFLKSRIFPFDDELSVKQVKEWLTMLEDAKMIIPFTHERNSLYVIRTFSEHQKIDKRYFKRDVPEEVVMSALGISKARKLTSQETTLGTHSDHIGCSTPDRIVNWIGEDRNIIVNGGVKAEQSEQEEFYICMFFRNLKEPKAEAQRFIQYNNGRGWKGSRGDVFDTLDAKMSLAFQWNPKEKGERCPSSFLSMWEDVFNAIRMSNPDIAKDMIDERAVGGFSQSGAVIKCKTSVSNFIKNNFEQLSPILMRWSGGRAISYQLS